MSRESELLEQAKRVSARISQDIADFQGASGTQGFLSQIPEGISQFAGQATDLIQGIGLTDEEFAKIKELSPLRQETKHQKTFSDSAKLGRGVGEVLAELALEAPLGAGAIARSAITPLVGYAVREAGPERDLRERLLDGGISAAAAVLSPFLGSAVRAADDIVTPFEGGFRQQSRALVPTTRASQSSRELVSQAGVLQGEVVDGAPIPLLNQQARLPGSTQRQLPSGSPRALESGTTRVSAPRDTPPEVFPDIGADVVDVYPQGLLGGSPPRRQIGPGLRPPTDTPPEVFPSIVDSVREAQRPQKLLTGSTPEVIEGEIVETIPYPDDLSPIAEQFMLEAAGRGDVPVTRFLEAKPVDAVEEALKGHPLSDKVRELYGMIPRELQERIERGEWTGFRAGLEDLATAVDNTELPIFPETNTRQAIIDYMQQAKSGASKKVIDNAVARARKDLAGVPKTQHGEVLQRNFLDTLVEIAQGTDEAVSPLQRQNNPEALEALESVRSQIQGGPRSPKIVAEEAAAEARRKAREMAIRDTKIKATRRIMEAAANPEKARSVAKDLEGFYEEFGDEIGFRVTEAIDGMNDKQIWNFLDKICLWG